MSIQDRGLDERRRRVLTSLREFSEPAGTAAARRAAHRLATAMESSAPPASHTPRPPRAMLAYGGGKDSSYMTAFVRLIQLMLAEQGVRLLLRIVTSRHAGMPRAVLENIDRAYRALGMYGDPDVELVIVDHDRVRPFHVDLPIPSEVVQRNRLDILMNGHRCFAEGRPTFCNACNLGMIEALAAAAEHGDGVDLIVTGDSPTEQRAYLLWVRRLARRLGVARRPLAGFDGTVATARDIADRFRADIHGAADGGPGPSDGFRTGPSFFSIYRDTEYRAADHWALLTRFLGFRFDDLAFSFTESDCANPALMAHLRGLRAERLYGLGYEVGIGEYVEFATGLMRAKELPTPLIETMRQRYDTPAKVGEMRTRIGRYASVTFGLFEHHLVCMAYSPFAGKGEYLEPYLGAEHPDLAGAGDAIRGLLAGADEPVTLAGRLEEVSGLTLDRLRTLYRSPLAIAYPGGPATAGNLIGLVLAGDPHRGVVETRRRPGGPVVVEMISGR
ncbi:hypothetical protein [Phytohabitans kaempferiae]|uniref:Uncharacterized protein n=1 Tax=Phytohabitans kaempferiae TaxID=1620943 RepID=A0ABV6M1R0_9ACTN